MPIESKPDPDLDEVLKSLSRVVDPNELGDAGPYTLLALGISTLTSYAFDVKWAGANVGEDQRRNVITLCITSIPRLADKFLAASPKHLQAMALNIADSIETWANLLRRRFFVAIPPGSVRREVTDEDKAWVDRWILRGERLSGRVVRMGVLLGESASRGSPQKPILNTTAGKILAILKSLPKSHALLGSELLSELAKVSIFIDESHLSRICTNVLYDHGVRNQRKVGYFMTTDPENHE